LLEGGYEGSRIRPFAGLITRRPLLGWAVARERAYPHLAPVDHPPLFKFLGVIFAFSCPPPASATGFKTLGEPRADAGRSAFLSRYYSYNSPSSSPPSPPLVSARLKKPEGIDSPSPDGRRVLCLVMRVSDYHSMSWFSCFVPSFHLRFCNFVETCKKLLLFRPCIAPLVVWGFLSQH